MVWYYICIYMCMYIFPPQNLDSPMPQRYGRNCQVPKGQSSITTGLAGVLRMDGLLTRNR